MILVCLTIAQCLYLKKQRLQWGWIMKRIKGHYIKEGKNLEKGKLYIIRKNRIVVFEEEETDDIVNIHFNIYC